MTLFHKRYGYFSLFHLKFAAPRASIPVSRDGGGEEWNAASFSQDGVYCMHLRGGLNSLPFTLARSRK